MMKIRRGCRREGRSTAKRNHNPKILLTVSLHSIAQKSDFNVDEKSSPGVAQNNKRANPFASTISEEKFEDGLFGDKKIEWTSGPTEKVPVPVAQASLAVPQPTLDEAPAPA
jgi:hypothetical protein